MTASHDAQLSEIRGQLSGIHRDVGEIMGKLDQARVDEMQRRDDARIAEAQLRVILAEHSKRIDAVADEGRKQIGALWRPVLWWSGAAAAIGAVFGVGGTHLMKP